MNEHPPSFLAWMRVAMTLVEDDYRFLESGGTIRYALDFNVIRFCQFPRANRRLARLTSQDTDEFQEAYASTLSSIISTSAGQVHASGTPFTMLAPHHDEFVDSRRQTWIRIEEMSKRVMNEVAPERFSYYASMDPDRMTDENIREIVKRLRDTDAPELFSLFAGDYRQALSARHFLEANLLPEVVPETELALEPTHRNLCRLLNAIDIGNNTHNQRRDARALIQLNQLNRQGASLQTPERILLLTTDLRLSALAN